MKDSTRSGFTRTAGAGFGEPPPSTITSRLPVGPANVPGAS